MVTTIDLMLQTNKMEDRRVNNFSQALKPHKLEWDEILTQEILFQGLRS